MSSETINPISPERFAAALQDLPLDALHAKAAELQHNISHLRSSNAQMLEFAEQGDQDCKDAMFENLGVIGRINERIELIRKEVEGRGMPFPFVTAANVERQGAGESDNTIDVTAVQNGDTARTETRTNGRLTDEELRRQLETQLENEDGGLHL